MHEVLHPSHASPLLGAALLFYPCSLLAVNLTSHPTSQLVKM